jgi:hypothetical protein
VCTKRKSRRTVEHSRENQSCSLPWGVNILQVLCRKASLKVMKQDVRGKWLQIMALLCAASMIAGNSAAAIKNMAVVISAGSKLSDVPLADLVKLCKGTQKSWADGKNFLLVVKNPEAPEMHVVAQKLFVDAGGDIKAAIAKMNESRVTIKIAGSDEELLRIVEATPGAVGIIDVYSINSSVKVLRVDGKLPFDAGYTFKGN